MSEKPILLSIIEVGGYPDFSPIYQQHGYDVVVESSMRKVLKFLKKNTPSVIVAEFNFQSDFRDRTSSLESMMSVVERMDNVRTVVFYEKEYSAQFDRLKARFDFDHELLFPIDTEQLAIAVR
ncbi:MAG: Unknown protein [uncultured Thiotrichaceae bacterium]|uniref:Response regulatory domain-containing protein n=1 Tax=uncultured Thiotrichaceae bacterium TaxID=298394 RepID=A0A6S6TM62_9GAMM|nr:MAG: Unknown protein [uncultured Thiotrichaceae bacterium]